MSQQRIGFEFEFLLPKGLSRDKFATILADTYSFKLHTFFHQETNVVPATIPKNVFALSKGFALMGTSTTKQPVIKLVDDVTICDDLDLQLPSDSRYVKIVSPVKENIALCRRLLDPRAGIDDILAPLDGYFGCTIVKENDTLIHAMLGHQIFVSAICGRGERERVCELVTAPVTTNEFDFIQSLLITCAEYGLEIPAESATHMHFDYEGFQSCRALHSIVKFCHERRNEMNGLFQTNHRCRKIGPFPDDFLAAVLHPDFCKLSWGSAQQLLRRTTIAKWHDVNLMNLIDLVPSTPTIEFRAIATQFNWDFYLQIIHYLSNGIFSNTQCQAPISC